MSVRARWSAIGAAVAVSLGAGSVLTTSAAISSGDRNTLVTIAPCRAVDTRPGPDRVGPRAVPMGAGDVYTLTVHGSAGNCSLPSDARAVVMSITVVSPSASSFLTVYPGDVARPTAANMTWNAGDPPTTNAATSGLAPDGRLSFYNYAGSVHLVVDVVGYYAGHDHDDRYYTKPQTEALVATAGPTAWGKVFSDGTFASSYMSPRVLTTSRESKGIYCIAFRDVIELSRLHSIVISGGGLGPVMGEVFPRFQPTGWSCTAALAGAGSWAPVFIYDENGQLVDRDFNFFVP